MTATNTAPAAAPTVDPAAAARAAAAQAAANKAAAARQAFSDRVNQHMAQISEAYAKADAAEASKGFTDLLKASQEIGFTWQDLAMWAPVRGDKAGDMELRVRALHDAAHYPSSPSYKNELARFMRLAVYAAKPDVVAKARTLSGAVYKVDSKERAKDSTIATTDDARTGLEKIAADRIAAGADNASVAIVQDFIAAIDDAEKLAKLGKRLNAAQSASTRWRSTLYLNLVGDIIIRRVDTSDTVKVAQVWDRVCAKAAKAHADFISNANGQAIDPTALENAVMKAAHAELDAAVGKIETLKPKATEGERDATVAAAVYRALRGALKQGLLMLNDFNTIVEMLETAEGMLPDVEGAELARKAEKDAEEKAAKEAQAAAEKAAKEAKAAADKAAKGTGKGSKPKAPQTLEEKKAAAQAAIAAAQAELDALAAAETGATDDDGEATAEEVPAVVEPVAPKGKRRGIAASKSADISDIIGD